MTWQPDPSDVIVLRDYGTGNMGSLGFGSGGDTNNKARFSWPEGKYVLSSIRAHFSGGSGSADVIVNLDSGTGPPFDAKLLKVTDLGTGGEDAHVRILPEEHIHWLFDGLAGDEVVLTWTNPDSGNMIWGVEVFLIPVKEKE